MTDEIKPWAGRINQISHALQTLGIDSTALTKTAAAFQLIAGSGDVIKGIIATKQAYNAAKAVYGTAHLAKYGPYALVVAGAAIAGGVYVGQEIERHAHADDSDAGLRLISGGAAFGRA